MDHPRHQLRLEQDYGDDKLLVCPEEGCGRRLVLHTRRGGMTVIDRGDFHALHHASIGGMFAVTAGVAPQLDL